MSSPYRDATTTGDAVEPMPQFRPKTHDVAFLTGTTAGIVAVAWLCQHRGDAAGATKLLVLWFPVLVISVAVLVFERPVRAWLERRHARIVVRGVAKLEAKIAQVDESP